MFAVILLSLSKLVNRTSIFNKDQEYTLRLYQLKILHSLYYEVTTQSNCLNMKILIFSILKKSIIYV